MTSVHLALVLLAFCVGHAFSEPIGKCPIPDPEERTEHLPDDTDCSKFWRCNHEIPKQETCPDGLHFNRVLQVCDWPIRAGCDSNTGSSQPPASPSSTSLPPRDTICEAATEDRWHIPHATDCTKFYKCDLNAGKATEFQCPDNLHFNAESQVCDWPSQAGCDSASGSSSSKPEITTSGSSSSKPEITTSGSSSSKPEITTSGSSSSTPEITTSTSTSTTTSPRDPICDSATEDRWHLPHPTDCTKFYKCDLSTGKATEIQCPDDLHFNAETEVCDWPSQAGCDPASGSSSKPEVTTSGSSSSKPEITTSGSSSPKPEITTSGSSSSTPGITTSTSTTTSPRDPICDSATEDRWHLPHPTDCTKFYKCDLSTGKATEIQCPDDLHFNAETEVCDWPSQAGCDPASGSSSKPEVTTSGSSSSKPEITTSGSSSPKPEITTSGSSSSTPGITTSTSTSTSTTTSPRDPICDSATEDRWHLPHPTDCTKFYKCDLSTGKATEIQCPDDLHFNAESEVCDWPGLAGCDPASGSSSSKPEITTSGSSSSKPEITTSGSSSSKPEVTTSGSSSSTPGITTSTSTSTTTSLRDPICDSATEDRWHLPHPTDCTKFYKCDLSTGKATEIQCPDDLHFNAETEVCDWPSQAGCDPASGSSSKPEITTSGLSSSKPEITTSGSSSSKPEITTSGSSSSKPEVTTSGSSSSTPGITTSTSTSTTTSLRDPICEGATEERWHLPHPTDCAKFFKCDLITGKATEFQCPDNLHFNAQSQVCDQPSQAGCESASGSSSFRPDTTDITTSTSTSTTTSPRDPICDGATEGRRHLPHPTDCRKFYKCDLDTGKATEFKCPRNLHFNVEDQVCGRRNAARCRVDSNSSSSESGSSDESEEE
ncbi:uncharacterized protein [Anabrus simplex]|uniref:uncharacterized protein n=1 Tax=Anabrus simplex TaxID=316456 RepID=UPI0035A2EC55